MEYTEEYLKKCDEKTIKYLYENQYDEDKGNIPSIDMIKEEGDIVYKIYCYGNYTKYLCRVFDDPDSNFNIDDMRQ
tara:strand:+ start:354 stop:581 length:228 start_codon:yes stop_codon:yes gene_type:complete